MRPCADCKKLVRNRSRGLCRPCYRIHDRQGTLKGFAPRRQSSEDVRYKKWLLSEPRVPADVIRPWIDHLIATHETLHEAARQMNVDSESVRRIWNGRWQTASYTVAEEIAVAAGRMVELAMAMPEVGVEGWSKYGRYCGDNSPLHHGCGSWHHPESGLGGGLCVECFAIATGSLDMETRDVRFAREVRA